MHVIGHLKAGFLEHGRPKQRVEVNDVFADKVPDLSIFVFPVRVERLAVAITPVLRRRDVADRRVHPDVEIFIGISRNLEAKIRLVARNIPCLKPLIEPRGDEVAHLIIQRARIGKFAKLLFEV